MGVPKFYRWLSERYPLINRKIGNDTRFLPEFDNFYLDMNGIIHNCSHPSDDDLTSETLTMSEMVLKMFAHIDYMVQVVRPQKVLYMAVDGCAPRAKMNQQRSRRFASARDARDSLEAGLKNGTITEEKLKSHFDSNCITPGTQFMAELSDHFQYFIRKKIKEDPVWRNLTVIYSGHDVPGEGEHKIMDYIRRLRLEPGYDPNTRHCCNSLDADLIMLGLATHEPHFSLLREEVVFGGRKKPDGGSTKERKRQVNTSSWELLDLNMLRQYLWLEFENVDMPFEFDLESMVDDWVVLVTTVGNDFLPHMPSVDVGEGALDEIMRSYREVLPTIGGFITEGGRIHPDRLGLVFSMIGDREAEVYADRAKKSKKGRRKGQEENVGSMEEIKAKYYSAKFGVDMFNQEEMQVVRHAVRSFYEGLLWCFEYYFKGCPSWTWFYPFHYAPMASDFVNLNEFDIKFTLGKPFKPFTQLLGCLPPASAGFLPKCYAQLMTSVDSPVIHFYPQEFEFDMNGKRNPWEAVNLLPFIRADELESAVAEYCTEDKLTPAEILRNQFGTEFIFEYNAAVTSTVPSTLPAVPEMPNIMCCESSQEPYILAEYVEATHKLLDGAVGNGCWPGDPQVTALTLLREECSLQEISINVFGRASRKESFVIAADLPETYKRFLKDGDITASGASEALLVASERKSKQLTVWVNYPYLIEAEVKFIADSEEKYELRKTRGVYKAHKTECSPQEISEFAAAQSKSAEVLLYGKGIPGTGGLDVDDVEVMFGVCPLTSLSINRENGAQEQHFDGQMVWVPLRATALKCPAPDKRFLPARARSVEERFPIGRQVMCLQKTGYGQVGTVAGYGKDRSKGELMIKFKAKSPQLPDFGHTIASSIVDQYVSTQVAAKHVGIKPSTLGKLAGSLFVKPERADIGLNLKVGREFKVLGYTRSKFADREKSKVAWVTGDSVVHVAGLEPEVGTDDNEANTGSMMWEYSARAIELVVAYQQKFPSVIQCIEQDPNSFQYEKSGLFPSAHKQSLEKLLKWREQLDTHHMPLVPVNSSAMSRDAIIAVQRASDDIMSKFMNQVKDDTFVNVSMSPSVVYTKDDVKGSQWFVSPTSGVSPTLGDRVSNLVNPVAPFGLRGTVVGVHPSTGCVDVLFDSSFIGGTNLYGACSTGRGLLVPYYQLLNLSRKTPLSPKKTQPISQKVEEGTKSRAKERRERRNPQNEVSNGRSNTTQDIAKERTIESAPVELGNADDDLVQFWQGLQSGKKQVNRAKPAKPVQKKTKQRNRKKIDLVDIFRRAAETTGNDSAPLVEPPAGLE